VNRDRQLPERDSFSASDGEKVAKPDEVHGVVSKDPLTKKRRSWNMSRIRGKDTTPERIVRSLLHRLGYHFRLHVRIPISTKDTNHTKPFNRKGTQSAQRRFPLRLERGEGQGEVSKRTPVSQPSTLNPQLSQRRFITPDIVLVKQRVAIFVHGCFWHRHRGCKNCTTPTHRRECRECQFR